MALQSFSEIIDRWQTATVLAQALNQARAPGANLRPVKGPTVRAWKHRDDIPPQRFPELAAAAQAWGFDDITEQALNALYNAKPQEQPAAPAGLEPSEFG